MADAATAVLEVPRAKIQVSGGANLTWWFESLKGTLRAPGAAAARYVNERDGVRAMYARLAREYDAELPVRDRRGGAPGDRFPL